MRILGIESSCDESGVAIYDSQAGLIAHRIYSQIKLHQEYGGIVPELASRDHIRKLLPLIKQVLHEGDSVASQISAVAYTAGPGLIGALLVGATLANSLAWAWRKPVVAIHHMEAHLLVPLMDNPRLPLPFIALLVSGGHSQLVQVAAVGKYQLLGETLDDAAGEAFDKTAKLLGLGYPGGPALSLLAQQGDPKRFHFPRPMTDRPGLDFSFSGLKTHAVHTYQRYGSDAQTKADIARAFEEAIVDTLVIKCQRALQQTGIQHLVISGGVSANSRLREKMQRLSQADQIQVHCPPLDLCTDNGAMIAYAGMLRVQDAKYHYGFDVYPRWSMEALQPPGVERPE